MAISIETHYFGENRAEFFRSYLISNSPELHPGMKRPAVIVCPGGGYNFLSDREEEPLALTFLQRGYHAFTLHYRIGSGQGSEVNVLPDALKQLAETVKTIREHADEWYVDRDKIVIVGGSAGAHLCACYSGLWHTDWLVSAVGGTDKRLIKPNACILLYPVIDCEKIYALMDQWGLSWPEEQDAVDGMTLAMAGEKHPSREPEQYPQYSKRAIYYPADYVTAQNPPTFIVHAADDFFIYVENTIAYIQALAAHRVPFETHIFEKGGHGFSLANEVTSNQPSEKNERTAGWAELACSWLKANGF